MVFVCPPKAEAEKKTKMLDDLKNFITKMEEELAIKAEPTYCIVQNVCCAPMCGPPCVPCPPCSPCQDDKDKDKPCELPDTIVCYKTSKGKSSKGKKNGRNGNGSDGHRLKTSTSRELRASILYVGCDCLKRDGLQDDCKRSDCQGRPECLTKPEPTCGPSAYASGKHLTTNKHKHSSGGGAADSSSDAGADETEATYVCFPARIEPPKMCLPTCMVPITCCPTTQPGNEES